MKQIMLVACLLSLYHSLFSQSVSQQLQKAYQQFEQDPQLKHASSSLYVINAKTGKLVYAKNAAVGLAPASTQKIITSITAFELLGKDYRYKTEVGYNGTIDNGVLNGSIFIIANGDPTFGSWRWESTKPERIVPAFANALAAKKISSVTGPFIFGTLHFDDHVIPNGWIWEDLGNYYGAGSGALNWKENQFDLLLQSGSRVGDPVTIIDSNYLEFFSIRSHVKAAAKGTGDNAYAYLPVGGSNVITVRGTIPVNEKSFSISAAIPDPPREFFRYFANALPANVKAHFTSEAKAISGNVAEIQKRAGSAIIYTHHSPSLDSIIYWFNKKSINLYGEALVRTLAYEKTGFGASEPGISIIRNFWKQNGIDENELNISDGSGLSPQNRVTTRAQVEILRYARSRDWYKSFYNALPDYNGMRMKSGTIRDVKGYCGYHTAKDGTEYIFSFLVNNYNGSASALVKKMYKVLDVLK